MNQAGLQTKQNAQPAAVFEVAGSAFRQLAFISRPCFKLAELFRFAEQTCALRIRPINSYTALFQQPGPVDGVSKELRNNLRRTFQRYNVSSGLLLSHHPAYRKETESQVVDGTRSQ